MNGSSASGLDDANLSSASCAEFDGYGGPLPASPSGNWYVAALTIGNAGRGVQVAHGYPNYNELYFRGGTDGWQGWRRVLNDANYASFALPLSGGSVTGYTQINNINFSGSADNYAGAAIWQDNAYPYKTHLNGYALSLGTGVNGNRVERMVIDNNGNIGIGTNTPQALLAVNGDIFSKKVKVTQSGWPDYVFHPTYKLPSLQEVERFIKQNNHLPDVPSAAQVEKEGLDLGDNLAVLLKKIEELTLYIIEQNKRIESLEQRLNADSKAN